MEIVGYQSKINITQVLPSEEKKIISSQEYALNRQLTDTSWLYDPFGDYLTYGVEFNLGKCFSWTFFLFAETIEMAEELGGALLYNLQERYKGLDGQVSVYPLYSKFLEINRNLYELILPSNSPLKLHLLRKIINYYKSPQKKMDATFFILWKRDNLQVSPEPLKFMLRTFVSLNPNPDFPMDLEEQGLKIKAILRYFVSDMSIPPYQKAECEFVHPSFWRNILMSKVFPKKPKYGPLPREFLPHYIKPYLIDFGIPPEMPLEKPPILENRNIVNLAINKNDPNYVYIGDKMNRGVLSTESTLIAIDSLTTHLNIFGKTGTGKSTLIKILLHTIYRKRPDVGILILNFVESDLEDYYPMAEVYKFPSKKFRLPYITPFNRTMISIKETSNVFAACLGLKHLGPGIFSETLRHLYSKYNKFPGTIKKFFYCVDDNMKAKSWEPEFKQHIRATFKRRIGELFYRDDLEATLNLIDDAWENIPGWFKKWKDGGFVIIDLTNCVEEEQHLIGMLILNMIDNLIPIDKEKSNRLKYLLMLDEAHRLLGKPGDSHPDSPEFIMKNKTNSFYTRIVNECRSKGVGIITAEQHAYLLHGIAIDSARMKILFQLGYPSNQIFTGIRSEREMLLTLQERYALVITNNERYLMRTADDNVPKLMNKS
ncbi:MAG: DUF87 domain-containing protein [Promethearchaeota archaeon]|nr:MAG: DUF87 domain-containing protein [Candidatus Lokiarchaeota archaeon]